MPKKRSKNFSAPILSDASSSDSPRIGAVSGKRAVAQGSGAARASRLVDKAATLLSLFPDRLEANLAAVKNRLKVKDTSSDEEEDENSHGFADSNPFAVLLDSENDEGSSLSDLDGTQQPQDTGPDDADTLAEHHELSALIEHEQLLQWAAASYEHGISAPAEAMIAQAAQAHAAAPTLQEALSAAALVSGHAMQQLHQWAVARQQRTSHPVMSSVDTLPQATAESEEVAQTGDAEAAAVANESTQGDGAEMAINHKQHQRVLRKNADIPERVSVLRGTSSSQAPSRDALEVTTGRVDAEAAEAEASTAIAAVSTHPAAATRSVASPAVQQSLPASAVQQSRPASTPISAAQTPAPSAAVQQPVSDSSKAESAAHAEAPAAHMHQAAPDSTTPEAAEALPTVSLQPSAPAQAAASEMPSPALRKRAVVVEEEDDAFWSIQMAGGRPGSVCKDLMPGEDDVPEASLRQEQAEQNQSEKEAASRGIKAMAGGIFDSAKGIVIAHPKACVAIMTVVGGLATGLFMRSGRRIKL